MSLATVWILNQQSFTPIPLPQDIINRVNCLVRRNPWGLNIGDIDRHQLLKDKDGAIDDPDNSTYAPSDGENRNNGDERDDNDTNINPSPDQ